jgi:hypothetical protein
MIDIMVSFLALLYIGIHSSAYLQWPGFALAKGVLESCLSFNSGF